MSDHAPSRFKTLQWFPVSFGVKVNFLSMSYKLLHGMASTCLFPSFTSLILSLNSVLPAQSTSPTSLLSVPRTLRYSHRRAFLCAIRYVWFAFSQLSTGHLPDLLQVFPEILSVILLKMVIISLGQYLAYPFPA